jgi:hypothetical protein
MTSAAIDKAARLARCVMYAYDECKASAKEIE